MIQGGPFHDEEDREHARVHACCPPDVCHLHLAPDGPAQVSTEAQNGTETPQGRLGAVLRLVGEPGPVALGKHGPWVATTAEQAKAVLTDPVHFDFPTDVSRRSDPRPEDAPTSSRSPHSITPPLAADAVARGLGVFTEELHGAAASLPADDIDVMALMRTPVARSTTSAVLPGLDLAGRDWVADLTLAWIDALGPVIASDRPPRRWSRLRRAEDASRRALEAELAAAGEPDPGSTATMLAAGIQVPIAAGAWLLVKLAEHPDAARALRADPGLAAGVAWETVRLCPPTWITARVARAGVRLGEAEVPEGAVVMVSPLLLGRLENLAPGVERGERDLADFDPLRWEQRQVRPGAWLPFGAGPHACPGRNLGLAQLTQLATWAADWNIGLVEPARVDQSRGIFPRPARLSFHSELRG